MKVCNYELPKGEYCDKCKMKESAVGLRTDSLVYCYLWESRLELDGRRVMKCLDCLEYSSLDEEVGNEESEGENQEEPTEGEIV